MTAPTQVSRGPNPDTQEKHVPVTVPILRRSVENGLPVTPGFHPSYTSKMSAVHTAYSRGRVCARPQSGATIARDPQTLGVGAPSGCV